MKIQIRHEDILFEEIRILMDSNVLISRADISPCVTTVWRYYIDNVIVSHNSFAPNYICSSYQTALSSVKWSKFIPTLIDLDTMIQVINIIILLVFEVSYFSHSIYDRFAHCLSFSIRRHDVL